MGDARKLRVNNALSSLVDVLIPSSTVEGQATADARRNDALELAKSIVEGHVVPQAPHWSLLTSLLVTVAPQ